MLLSFLLLADGDPQPQGSFLGALLPMLPVLILLFYFMVLRPERRRESERQALVKNLDKNDKVLTASGIYGTVISVSDKEDEVVVRVDDNTRLRMIKSSIARNVTKEEAFKQAKEQKTGGA